MIANRVAAVGGLGRLAAGTFAGGVGLGAVLTGGYWVHRHYEDKRLRRQLIISSPVYRNFLLDVGRFRVLPSPSDVKKLVKAVKPATDVVERLGDDPALLQTVGMMLTKDLAPLLDVVTKVSNDPELRSQVERVLTASTSAAANPKTR